MQEKEENEEWNKLKLNKTNNRLMPGYRLAVDGLVTASALSLFPSFTSHSSLAFFLGVK